MRNRFVASNGHTWDWPINHSEEESSGAQDKNIDHTGNTGRVGLVRQQGDPIPLVIRVSGTIFHLDHLRNFHWWTTLTNYQSIHFRDSKGNQYEVIISKFEPRKQRVLRNPRDEANAPGYIWKYTMEMEVLRVISGDLAGVI